MRLGAPAHRTTRTLGLLPAWRRPARDTACGLLLAACALLLPPSLSAHPQAPPEAQAATPAPPAKSHLLLTVVDENGVPVRAAQITLTGAGAQGETLKGESDYAGRLEFAQVVPGSYRLHVEKEGFYAVEEKNVHAGEAESVEVTLNHVKEYVESVDVVYSPPAIDLQKTSGDAKLTNDDMINLPFTVTRDIRYALPLLPGVLQDAFGQLHVNGASTRQVQDQLDGFNVSDPATGFFDLRVSVDALRSADVLGSRASAEYGKGSAGALSLTTGMGDDHLRYSATDFVPSLQNVKGLHVNTWMPRATLTGPLRKGKAWFLEALDGDYNLNILRDLPAGADQSPAWRISNLAKAQFNLTPAQNLTGTFLVNRFGANYEGLSPFAPLETTLNERDSAYFLALKDQALLRNGVLLEAGVALLGFHSALRPLGDKPYVITPDTTRGNYYSSDAGRSSRLQAILNLILPPAHGLGRHEFRVGTDLDRITGEDAATRRDYSILREDGTLSREVRFLNKPAFSRDNLEASGYAQDRWSITPRWLVEGGARLDWDQILHRAFLSPRLASSLALTADGETKLTAGIGRYYDASNLEILTRNMTGTRFDSFYDSTGTTLVRPPVQTSFLINERALREPSCLNSSVGLERRLPTSIYLQVEYLRRRGVDGWTFINQGALQGNLFSGQFVLTNQRQDHYDALQVSARRMFKGNHVVFASYTRSAARTTAVLTSISIIPCSPSRWAGPSPGTLPTALIPGAGCRFPSGSTSPTGSTGATASLSPSSTRISKSSSRPARIASPPISP